MAIKKSEGSAEIVETTSEGPALSQIDVSEKANIAPATEFNASGAPQQIVPDVDVSHPAVDNDPRAGTTINQNKIDFNDPTIPGHVAVERALGMASADSAAESEKGE